MPEIETAHFGKLEYGEESVVHFPDGLPAFEHRRRFLLIERASSAPLLLLQSLEDPDLCFVTLPVDRIVPGYRLSMSADDCHTLGLDPDAPLHIGQNVICLAILTLGQQCPTTANLLSPVVIEPVSRRAVQAIQIESPYSHQHPLFASPEAPCS